MQVPRPCLRPCCPPALPPDCVPPAERRAHRCRHAQARNHRSHYRGGLFFFIFEGQVCVHAHACAYCINFFFCAYRVSMVFFVLRFYADFVFSPTLARSLAHSLSNSSSHTQMHTTHTHTHMQSRNCGRSYIYRSTFQDAADWEHAVDKAVVRAKKRSKEEVKNKKDKNR